MVLRNPDVAHLLGVCNPGVARQPAECAPADCRVYRHSGTGEEAYLSARPIGALAGGQWWEVRLVRADGRPWPVAGQAAVECWPNREAAREGYRKRLRALRAEGWVGVE